MGEAPAVLDRRRLAAAGGLVAVLLVYWETALRFPDLSDWGDVFWTGIVLGAPLFGLVWVALPLARRAWPWLVAAMLACAGLAIVASLLDLAGVANVAKLGAATFAGFLFLHFFQEPSWLVLVALVIPFADTLSVWRGPTKVIITEQPGLFDAYSVAFPPPGERVFMLRWGEVPGATRYVVRTRRPGHAHTFELKKERAIDLGADAHERYRVAVDAYAGKRVVASAGAAVGEACGSRTLCDAAVKRRGLELRLTGRLAANRLGLTDVIFFALFLGGAARFGLRTGWTWVGLLVGFTLSGVAALLDPFGTGGVPALPFIALGFLLPNADLLWRLRGRQPDG